MMSTSIFTLLLIASFFPPSESACARLCDLAIGSYYVSPDLNLSYISSLFGISYYDEFLPYNPGIIDNNFVSSGSRINVSVPCECIKDEFLGHMFTYVAVGDETYDGIVDLYSGLTTSGVLQKVNSYPPEGIPEGGRINVSVSCFCGNKAVSGDYGLFVTYPLRDGDRLESLAERYGFAGEEELLQRYNPGMDFSAGEGIVFIPIKDTNGSYRPLVSSNASGLSSGAIAGVCVAAGAVGLLVAICLLILLYRRKKANTSTSPTSNFENNSNFPVVHVSASATERSVEVTRSAGSAPAPFTGITVDKSVEFSYQELAKATNDFDLSNQIGEGGFGAIYYAELRGEKAAIKKMDIEASNEFLAELKVLTHVHHLNLVRLIGYCTERSLFLVYEYIENGNLDQHLRGSGGWDPLPWSVRVQIALDSARGLEYVHEHTVPVYVHRDIKSANILIDKNLHGKVTDFGLAKLTESSSSSSLIIRLVGTFGYMPPEYAKYGDVSPKVDVYAFGVVLYELISAKQAIVKSNESTSESKSLVDLFEDALKQEEPMESLQSLIDVRLGDNYPIESVLKMAQLARACTQENPQLRPSMRSIVVALMTLLSPNEEWDMGFFYENQTHLNLMTETER